MTVTKERWDDLMIKLHEAARETVRSWDESEWDAELEKDSLRTLDEITNVLKYDMPLLGVSRIVGSKERLLVTSAKGTRFQVVLVKE